MTNWRNKERKKEETKKKEIPFSLSLPSFFLCNCRANFCNLFINKNNVVMYIYYAYRIAGDVG